MAQIRESLKIKEPKVFDYNGQPLRIVIISEAPWWVLTDICKILDLTNPTLIARAVEFDDKMFAKIRTTHSAQKVYVINENGLNTVMQGSETPNVIEFRKWLDKEELLNGSNNATASEKTPVSKSSIEVSMQRAGMFIRMAEHKAVPQIEQRRLLNMAIRELTGSELEFEEAVSESTVKSDKDTSIMDLPEVVGVIGYKEPLKIGQYNFYFYPVKSIAARIHITPLEFDNFANEHGLKDNSHGIWKRVKTPEGEAREFLYMEEIGAFYLLNQKR